MTKSTKGNRFNYAKPKTGVVKPEVLSLASPEEPALPGPVLTTVARRKGRMEQDREQLNVRLPTQLKRRALAAAALEGLTIGELIERLLLEHLSTIK